jgi:hypothetical protein
MKLMLAMLALACAACATEDKVADEGNYRPPEYRTGSNLPSRGGTHASPEIASTTDAQGLKNSLPPSVVPNRGD